MALFRAAFLLAAPGTLSSTRTHVLLAVLATMIFTTRRYGGDKVSQRDIQRLVSCKSSWCFHILPLPPSAEISRFLVMPCPCWRAVAYLHA